MQAFKSRENNIVIYQYQMITIDILIIQLQGVNIVNVEFLEEISDGVVVTRPWLYRKY